MGASITANRLNPDDVWYSPLTGGDIVFFVLRVVRTMDTCEPGADPRDG